MSRYLKQGKTGQVYPFTEHLAKRPDMAECDKDGNLLESPKPAAVLQDGGVSAEAVEQAVREAVAEERAKVSELAKARFNIDLDPNTPVDQMIDAILVAHEESLESKPEIDKMTKAQLLAYAKQKYNIDLDPELKVDAMRAKLRELAGE
jgi:hypothetical protein